MIVEVLYGKPVRELLVDAVRDMPPSFRRRDVVLWFRAHYPAVKEGTVTAHITAATVNSPSRHHYGAAAQSLLFKRPGGSLERYEARRHGRWSLYGELLDHATLEPEPESEPAPELASVPQFSAPGYRSTAPSLRSTRYTSPPLLASNQQRTTADRDVPARKELVARSLGSLASGFSYYLDAPTTSWCPSARTSWPLIGRRSSYSALPAESRRP